MISREIDKTLVICICRKPVSIQVAHGETVRVTCSCGNVIVETFPSRKIADRKAQIIKYISQEPTSRWDAIQMELLQDELMNLRKIVDSDLK